MGLEQAELTENQLAVVALSFFLAIDSKEAFAIVLRTRPDCLAAPGVGKLFDSFVLLLNI